MQEENQLTHIIEKLNQGIPFGLFVEGQKCYFRDGESIHYGDLWKAVREMHNLGDGPHNKTLFNLFPESFEGVFEKKFNRHIWRKR